jgi:hypothetical protein
MRRSAAAGLLKHGCLLWVVSVVRCQIEIPATSRSLVQRIPSDCDSSLCVTSEDWETKTVGLLFLYMDMICDLGF